MTPFGKITTLAFCILFALGLFAPSGSALLAAPSTPGRSHSATVLPRSVNITDAGAGRAARPSAAPSRPSRPSVVRTVNNGVACTATGPTYCTIQPALDASSAGDTVSVAAGVYSGNLTITQPVTLVGAGQGVTTLLPGFSGPVCSGGSLCTGHSSMVLVQSNNVTIHDLTLDGDNPSLTSGVVRGGADLDARNGIITNHNAGTYQNLVVYNATIRNIYLRGMYASSGGTFNFHDNTVRNVQGEGASIAIFNFYGSGTIANNTVSDANDAISSNWSAGVQFLNNTVTNSGSGIHTDNTDGADLIQGNTIVGGVPDSYGIFVFAVDTAIPTIQNNKITGCDVGLSIFGGRASGTTLFTNNIVNGSHRPNSVGVYVSTTLFSFGEEPVQALFTNNSIVNFDTALYVEQISGCTGPCTATLTAHNNNIFDNNYGSWNGPTNVGTIDASSNWWGASDGPGPGGSGNPIYGPATVNPFLTAPSSTVLAAVAHLEPNSGAPANGGTVAVGTGFSLDLKVMSGNSSATVAQSYLTFTNSILQVGNMTAPGGTCVTASSVTRDNTTFDTELQNQVCNGSSNCTFSMAVSPRYPNLVAPPASIAFASGLGTGETPPAPSDFRVAQVPFCAVGLGDGVIHWQYSPTAPVTRNSFVEDDNGNRISEAALAGDYTVHVVEPVVAGHLTWQGRPAQPNSLNVVPVTLSLRSVTGGAISTFTTTTDASGYFTVTVTGLANGSYNWRVKGPQTLATNGSVSLNRSLVTTAEFGLQKTGDANDDNVVNSSDYNILRRYFGFGTDLRADFNGDGIVNSADFSLLRPNFGTGGSDPLTPAGAPHK